MSPRVTIYCNIFKNIICISVASVDDKHVLFLKPDPDFLGKSCASECWHQCFCCQLDRCQELKVWINSLLLPSLVSQETCVVKTKRSTCKSNIELFWMIYQEINRRIWCYTISLKISCQLLGVVMDHFLACYEN